MTLKGRLIIQTVIAQALSIAGGEISNPKIWMPLLLIGGFMWGDVIGHIMLSEME